MLQDLESRQTTILTKGMELARAKINDPTLETRILANLEAEMTAAMEKVLTGATGATNSPASLESPPEG